MNRFDAWYSMYPRKKSKADALKAWARLTDSERTRAVEALPLQLKEWSLQGQEMAFMPYPATWLNGKRYEDEFDLSIPDNKVNAWWASEQGILAAGAKIGESPRPGEDMATYKARIATKMRAA